MARPFLTIITRCYKRPALLGVNKASVAVQDCQDLEHVFLVDEVGVGIWEATKRMAASTDLYHGRYIYVLDDDDQLIDPGFVRHARNIARVYDPDVIMVKSDNAGLGILPDAAVWGQNTMLHGHVSTLNFVVRAEVWKRHARAWGKVEYEGDYTFISEVFRHNPVVYWSDRIVAAVQRISRGAPE